MNLTKESGDYPPGAEYDSKAPYNQSEDEVLINVTISQTLSATATIIAPIGYVEKDLEELVHNQILLPLYSINCSSKETWVEDDFAVIKEE